MKSMTRRILIMFCCTVLLSSSVFMSYENTLVVKAVDESDLLHDCILAVLAAIGVYATGGSAGTLAMVLAPFITDTGFDIYDYITQNETSGTTTISADFVNLVLQAYLQYREENGEKFDGLMEPGSNGYYHYDSLLLVKSGWNIAFPNDDFDLTTTYTDINTFFPMAVVVYSNRTSSENSRNQISRMYGIFYNKTENEFYAVNDFDVIEGEESLKYNFSQALGGYLYVGVPQVLERYTKSGNTRRWENYVFFGGSSGGHPPTASLEAYSASIPVYHSLSAAMDGLRSGDFSGAYNYGKMPDCETPAYTGTYDGGDITVPTEKLEGIQDKLDEIDQTDKDIYEKLKELLEWLIGNGGGTSGSIDLTTTNSWLEKIYLKVCQIFDKLSETAGGAVDTVNTKLQETLDEMLAQLKEISGDVSDIKGQLENMSEQEFDEKSDSFLGEIMDAFAEISEVVKTKFPFSIPNDLRIFLSKIAPAAPETGEQQIESYSLDSSSGMTFYSGEHGGGGTSDGETNPPGGGGSSRPGSGFVGVDHGGSGGSRDPVEMREAPVFRLPIVIERYGIEEYIIIDMSPFDPLSRFSRSFFTIIFMVCLFNLTFKVIGMWGDIIG